MNGFLSLLKPPGMTSQSAVGFVRRRLSKGIKIGHAGTLDPEAAGVLPLMIGKATRLFEYTTEKRKTYVTELIPNIETDTQDYTGKVISRSSVLFDRTRIEQILPNFTGEIQQIPPMYSALKVDGKRLYELAREGTDIERSARTVTIESIHLLSETENHTFLLQVTCGRGTYMRTLCHDIGHALGGCACMGTLIRTAAGPFTLNSSATLEEIERVGIEPLLLPMDYPLSSMDRIDSDICTYEHIRSGNLSSLVPPNGGIPEKIPLRLYWQGEFCGIIHLEGNRFRVDCMLLS